MPREGLNIPIVTALDEAGEIIESDQRQIIRYTIHHGHGADSLFICGTTGEYNRISNRQRQRLLEIGVDETRIANSLLASEISPVEAWVGITAATKNETLENLALAKHLKADLAVIAPFAIDDLQPNEISSFFENEIAAQLGKDETLSIGLYDNPDIAADFNNNENLPVSIINSIRHLPFIACLKASTTRPVLSNYVSHYAADVSSNFTLYAGNAELIFELSEIGREAQIGDKKAIVGVVSGTANVFPCEWQRAWQAVAERNENKISLYRNLFAKFSKLTGFPGENGYSSKLIGSIKQAMFDKGIISSAAVANGTPKLTADEAAQLNEGLDELLAEMRTELTPEILSTDEVQNFNISAVKSSN